ncbi:MAG: DUF3390 domain-containing protein, partial [Desulfobulbaceae bacterium]|nr:DUF3390 domain-containing protein [Desulfobulbaceae bacterium]
SLVWNLWSWANTHPALYRLGCRFLTRLRGLVPKRLGVWTRVRKAPAIAPKTLHELAREMGIEDE